MFKNFRKFSFPSNEKNDGQKTNRKKDRPTKKEKRQTDEKMVRQRDRKTDKET